MSHPPEKSPAVGDVRWGNLLDIGLSSSGGGELVEVLLEDDRIRIERIVSNGDASAPGFWYDQETDEWVVLIQGDAELSFENGVMCRLRAGDWYFIPKHCRHRVDKTSSSPPAVWLALHMTGSAR